MNIADRIQNLRKTRGISQEKLADEIGVSRQAVSKWESEQSMPDLDKIILISDFFEVTTDYLLKGMEGQKQDHWQADGRIFVAIATSLNFIGLMTALVVWLEYQTLLAIVLGIMFMAGGCFVFSLSQFVGQDKARAKFWFFMVNIWLVSLMPITWLFNLIWDPFAGLYQILRPFPSLEGSTFRFGLTILTYLGLGLGLDLYLMTRLKK